MFFKNNWIRIILALIILAIGGTLYFFYANYYKLYSFNILGGFKKEDDLVINFERCENVLNYEVILKENDKLISKYIVSNDQAKIPNISCYNDKKLIVSIYAKSKMGKVKKANNDYLFYENNRGIKKCQNEIMVNDDYEVLFTNYEENIKIVLNKGDTLLNEKVTGNNYLIKGDYFKETGEYEILLIDNDKIIDKQLLEVKPLEITNLKIENDSLNSISWDGFYIWFSGGKNATNYEINLINNNKIIDSKKSLFKYYYVDPLLLKEDETYEIEIIAFNDLLQPKKVSAKFKMPEKAATAKPYSDRENGKIFLGKMVRLYSLNTDAKIYYTTNGTLPTTSSTLYEGPIMVDRNITIKAIAVSENYKPSTMTVFRYIEDKRMPTIYLSPSTQYWNIGNGKVGYTNEQEIMNKVADKTEILLKEKGFTVYRNTLDMNYKDAGRDSKNKDADLHLAIHSNASTGSWATGIETWVYTQKSYIAPLAIELQKALEDIYYKENTPYSGIKYNYESDNILFETNPVNVNNGILVEVAYHDQIVDAKWIMNNIDLIGKTIADTVIFYYLKDEELTN